MLQEKHLCLVGVDKHWIEKDLVKFFRKSFSRKPVLNVEQAPVANEDKTIQAQKTTEEHDIPIKGVAKKRGKTFAFLQFADLEEKQAFVD